MMDQYREQYKKETEEIHAPADLIARTKAAVRREEERIQRQQEAKPVAQEGKFPVQEIPVLPRKSSRGAAAHKWAYPLSAVAAVIVLASVSLMLQGLDKSSSESPVYEMAAADADSGGEESAAAGADTWEDVFALEEVLEESAHDEAAVEAPAAEAFPEEGTDSADGAAKKEDFASDKGMDFADDTAGAAAEMERASGSTDAVSEALPAEEGETENATAKELEIKEALADKAADITVEKVWKKPAFVNRKDIESRTYEDMVFQIVEEENGWAAYVESGNGGGYVIRGEAESVEAFLEEGYRRVTEISF